MPFPEDGVWPNIPAAVYHLCETAYSRSQLEDLRKSAPLFHARHLARTIPFERTDALDFGHISHEVMLGGKDRIAVIPDEVLTADGKRYGNAWDEYKAANKDKWLLTSKAADKVVAMSNAAYAEPAARALLDTDGDIEVSLVNTDGGLRLRGRLDKLFYERASGLDIKTTADPSPSAFKKTIARYGYHRQAAWYRRLVCRLCDWKYADFEALYFIAIGKDPPHDVCVYRLSDDAMEQGEEENRAILSELRRRLDEDDWHLPTRGGAQLIDLPSWAYPAVELSHGGKKLEI